VSNVRQFAIPALILLTLISYAGTFQNQFVNFDDDRYVTQNDIVLKGLSFDGLQYAFTTTRTGNWIPLTWLSLQLDVSLFGRSAVGFHATNLLLHLANVLLFFVLLQRLGGTVGMAFLGGALFAVHPLHVESVAWLSERKDVLSTLFLLLTMLQYVQYTKQPDWRRFAAVLSLLALGLLAKPMLVTLPVLLLLVDVLILRRCRNWSPATDEPAARTLSLTKLILEKIPLLLVVVVMSGVTMFAQKSDLAFVSYSIHPVGARVANALCSVVWYLQKTVVPTGLCIFYPLEYGMIDWPRTIVSAVILATITALVLWQSRRRPWLLFGWGWFLISLLPVSGLLQVGGQARADRFTYVPHLGLFLAIVWQSAELVRRFQVPRVWQSSMVGLCLLVLSGLTVRQVGIWNDSVTLWTHANQTAPDNWMARLYLGIEKLREKDWNTARDLAQQSLQIRPYNADALALAGKADLQQQRWESARQCFLQGLEINPKHRDSLIGLAAVCHGTNRPRDAERLLRLALEFHPRDSFLQLQLGLLYGELGNLDAALQELQRVTREAPQQFLAWKAAGQLLAQADRIDEAIDHFHQAYLLVPEDVDVLTALERLHEFRGDDELAPYYRELARKQTRLPATTIQQTSGTLRR